LGRAVESTVVGSSRPTSAQVGSLRQDIARQNSIKETVQIYRSPGDRSVVLRLRIVMPVTFSPCQDRGLRLARTSRSSPPGYVAWSAQATSAWPSRSARAHSSRVGGLLQADRDGPEGAGAGRSCRCGTPPARTALHLIPASAELLNDDQH
jgi:hypothetical protein